MDFQPIKFDQQALARYTSLFERCFSRLPKFSPDSLSWLYAKNPDGAAVGFDAFAGDELAGHYVCIPATIRLNGTVERSLLSLNTATHPSYQGKGLFTKLAAMTYQAAAEQGYGSVFGVANANSTPGFVRKLGFTLVEPLKAMVGIGRLGIDFESVVGKAEFERVWTPPSLTWRCANPANNVRIRTRNDFSGFEAQAMGDRVRAYAELPGSICPDALPWPRISPLRLYLGLAPAGTCTFRSFFSIPERLRPSPLNFIFKNLRNQGLYPAKGSISFSFLDFDAY